MSHGQLARSANSRRFVRKLSAYAAAGASLAATDLSAAIVYTDLGPDGIRIFDGFHEIDFDANGRADVTLTHDFYREDPAYHTFPDTFYDVSAGGGVIVAPSLNGRQFFAKAFDYGELIRRSSNTSGGAVLAYRTETTSNRFSFGGGEFYGLHRAYLGITFMAGDDSHHMAWVAVDAYHASRLKIFGYAYETTPERSIRAGAVPEPPSLVLLAAGAAGLVTLRTKRRTQS